MKTRIALLTAALALFLIATVVVLADKGGNDKARGWPNAGIESPGHPLHGPHAYAGPGEWQHP